MQWLVFSMLCLIWGFSWIGIKFTLEGFPPFLGATLRFGLALPLLWMYARVRGVSLRVPREAAPLIAVTAVLTYGIDYGLIYWGEQFLSPGVTAILFATFPLFTAAFSLWMLPRDQPSLRIYVGLCLGLSGVAVTYGDELFEGATISHLLAPAAVVTGAAAAALATVLIKRNLIHLHPVPLNLHQLVTGTLSLLVLSLLSGETWPDNPGPRAWFGVVYLAAIASALAFSLYYWLLRRVSAVAVSTMVFVNPLVALAADWMVFGTPVGPNVLAGMVLVFAGVLLCRPR